LQKHLPQAPGLASVQVALAQKPIALGLVDNCFKVTAPADNTVPRMVAKSSFLTMELCPFFK